MLRSGLVLLIALLPLSLAAADAKFVEATPYGKVQIHPVNSAPATVLSLNDSWLGAEIPAAVSEIAAEVGSQVAAGAAVLRLDCTDMVLQRRSAEAALAATVARFDFASYQLKRANTLAASNNISEEQLHQRRAEAAALTAEQQTRQAALELAQKNEQRCVIRAPFPALVMERKVSIGERRGIGEPLVRLLDLSRIEVSAQIQAADSEQLKASDGAELTVGGQTYPLKVRAVLPALDPRSRSREARLRFAGSAAVAGSSGRLVWRDPMPHVPAELIQLRGGKYGVFVVDGQRARFISISGVSEGRPGALRMDAARLVITSGHHSLQDGDPIKLVNETGR